MIIKRIKDVKGEGATDSVTVIVSEELFKVMLN